jgi:putative phosphoesterase
MRVAALYDVHGNLQALEAVLADPAAQDVDAIVLGGDMVLGPFPDATLARLRELRHAHWLRGNCEDELDGDHSALDPEFGDQLAWCAHRLGDEAVAELASLPEAVLLDVDGLGTVRFCHATPGSLTRRITRITPEPELLEVLDAETADVVVCGHTHVQFDRQVGRTRLVNAGSVGWPWEDERGAYWALLGPEVELRRTEYDVDAAVAAFGADFPDFGFGESLLSPPGAEATTMRFEEARR